MGITLYSHFIFAATDDFFAFLDSFLHSLLKQLVRQCCSLHGQTQTKINPNPFSPDPSTFLHLCPHEMQLLNTLSPTGISSYHSLTVETLTQLLSGC